jgi:PncC family amidohydrolase
VLHHLTGDDFTAILRRPVLAQTSVTRVRVEDVDGPVYRIETIGDTAHFGSDELHAPDASVWNQRGSSPRSEPLGERAARLLLAKERTISTAESLTGGLLAASLIASELGISASFMEGYVTYSNAAKMRDLNVREATLMAHGAVSAETAREMAMGCQAKSGTDFALATTGIAGPTGGSAEKPVGLTYIGICHGAQVEVLREVFAGDRAQIRQRAVDRALGRLIELLEMDGPVE